MTLQSENCIYCECLPFRMYEWDVCNEYVHKHFYEDASGVLDLLERQFKLAHEVDPNTKLCLNDYEITRGGGMQASVRTLF